ncbi:helix-turn-helix transcriptional regulator [Georgenia muralis]
MSDEFAEQVAGIGSLAEPARQALYLYVASRPDAVGRDEAAAAVDLPRHTAKFHLDRLVEEGLLEVEFRRLTGRTGPGAGRPSKLYRRSGRHFGVSLPERRYDLAGDVLAEAIDRAVRDDVPVAAAVREAASARGRGLAAAGEPATAGDPLARTSEVLARYGYEPRDTGGAVCLANCPFDRLASEHTALVCAMNLALIGGVIEGLGATSVAAELDPAPGRCCVRLAGSEAPAVAG